MAVVFLHGCCDELVDLDYYGNTVIYENKTDHWWHAECALDAGKITQEQYEKMIQEF